MARVGIAMLFDIRWWWGFISGFLLFSVIFSGVFFQVRIFFVTSVPRVDDDGAVIKVGRWRIALMVGLLALKTFGVGVSVYVILVVLRLSLSAVGAGLFVGLAVMVVGAMWVMRFGSKKRREITRQSF